MSYNRAITVLSTASEVGTYQEYHVSACLKYDSIYRWKIELLCRCPKSNLLWAFIVNESPKLSWFECYYHQNHIFNHISSSLSRSMVATNSYLLLFGLRTFHRSPTWNPISAFNRFLILGQRHYKMRWPMTHFSFLLIGFLRGAGIVRSYLMTPKYKP